jgi:hypothetical protein
LKKNLLYLSNVINRKHKHFSRDHVEGFTVEARIDHSVTLQKRKELFEENGKVQKLVQSKAVKTSF